ncbi:hypothetical protein KY366_08575 [Candidatus Woesearchaeota archaeon]|nr:hypothetical protein [Candidatus Woesearchaeota archaeon]
MVDCRYFPQNSTIEFDTTVADNIANDVDKTLTYTDMLEKEIVREIFPSDYHSFLGDRGPHLRENTALSFAEWCSTGKEDQTVEYVETAPTKIFAIPTEGTRVFYNKGGVKMADCKGSYDFRDTGKLASMAHTLQKHAEDFMKSDEGYEFALNHSGLLKKAPEIDYIVISSDPDMIYGVAPISEDSVVLLGNIDSYKKIDNWAQLEGIETDAFIKRAIGEEYAHIVRKGKPTVQEEIDVRGWLINIYTSLSEKTKDAGTKEKYQKMISALERDRATVRERYSKSYSKNINALVKMYNSSSHKLEALLKEEAQLEYNLTDKDAISEYVSIRMSQIKESADKDSADYQDLDARLTEYSLKDVEGETQESEVCQEGKGSADSAEGESGPAEGAGGGDGGGGDGGE